MINLATKIRLLTMLKSADDDEVIEIPPELVKKESYLYKLLTQTTLVGIKKDENGIIIVNNTSKELKMIRDYVMYGTVGDANEMLTLFDYFGVYEIKGEYPEAFIQIKLKEDWYRTSLYHPEYKNSRIHTNDYDLIKLSTEHESQFLLLNKIVYMYSRKIYHPKTVKKSANYISIDQYVNKDQIERKQEIVPDTQKYKNSPLLLHSYGRPYHVENTVEEIKRYISEANELFTKRDEQFGHNVIRETDIGRRPIIDYRQCKAEEDIYKETRDGTWQQTIDNIKRGIEKYEIVKRLKDAGIFENVLLAGGAILNRIVDYNMIADYDLFIYGLTEEEATAKVRNIIKLFEVRNIGRSENAITINNEIQIILRLYRTKAEILHGFDVDCCCVGYDGTEILATPRALFAIENMINVVDFDRMSPTYELRLSKYMLRGFAIYIPGFDPSLIQKDSIKAYQLKRGEKPKGLDILITNYYFPKKYRYYQKQSDYDTKGIFKVIKDFKPREDKVRVDFNFNNQREIVGYKIVNSFRFDGEYQLNADDIELIFDIKDKLSKFPHKVPPTLKWKIINPGEQATSTFHVLVLNDISQWYKGQFYTL